MKKCTRVKNPCKICLQTVTNKSGLQCKGACKKWAHYACLNYTPGKIQDIKNGIITITCPCPNCNTQEPKEYLTDPPYTCTNEECPANKLPQCQINECPLNDPHQFTSRGVSPQSAQVVFPPPPRPPSLPPQPPLDPQNAPCGPGCSVYRHTPPTSSPEMMRIPPEPYDQAPPQSSYHQAKRAPSPSAMTPCISSLNEVPPCLSQPVVSQVDSGPRSPRTVLSPQTGSRIPSQIRVLTPHMVSKSCSCLSRTGHMTNVGATLTSQAVGNEDQPVLRSGDGMTSCSDSKLSNNLNNKENQKILISTIHQLCSTVGHLSSQIKDLICKMMTNIEKDC